MDSTVTSRPNHYDALGLKPSATAEEIARAFTLEMRRPRAPSEFARLGVAYETLRDPAKRRAYDSAMGLIEQRKPSLQQRLTSAPAGAPFQRTAPVAPPILPTGTAARERQEPAAPTPTALPPQLAAALHPLAQPGSFREAPPTPQPASPPPPVAEAAPPEVKPTPAAPEVRPQPRQELSFEPQYDHIEETAVDWKRIGLAGGALVAVAGLLGIWAASDTTAAVEEPASGPVARATLPPPTPIPADLAAATPAQPVAGAPESATASAPAATPRASPELSAVPAQAAPIPAAAEPSGPDQAQAESEPAGAPVAADGAPEEAAAPAAAAALPLPNRVIARTIERIGYACGEVASAAPVEGAGPGVFKVSCTSGQAYQARPVGGRYHFRRWGRQ